MNTRAVTRFGIIRHAPTLWNEQKRIQGQQDSPLSARGRAMAEKWGVQLHKFTWDRLFCSDLGRVEQTSGFVNLSLHLPVVTEPRLREQDWGTWTGMTVNELKTQDKNQVREQEQRGWDFQPPGGESRRDVLARSMAALTAAHAAWPGENILVVCHEGIIKCLLYHLLDRQFLPEEPKVILNYHLHILTTENNELSLEQMNHFALRTIPIKDTGP